MLPISPSADGAHLGRRPRRRACAHIGSASLGREQQQHGRRSCSPTTPSTMPVTSASAAPIGLDGVGDRQHAARSGTEMSTERPSMLDSAVQAVPEPMLASSRSASSWRSVYWAQRGSFQAAGGDAATSTTASQSTIRAICPSDSTAAPDRAAPSATSGGSGRVTSSRWPTRRLTASAKRAAAAAHDHGVVGVGVARAAEALGRRRRSAARRRACTSIRRAGDRADGVVGEADGALDAVERDRERAAVGLDEQRGHDRQRQRQADLRRSCPAPSSEVIRTSPPSSRIAARTASMPTPRPEMSLVTSAVEKPGWKSSSTARAMSIESTASAAISPRSAALRATARGVDAAAVVARP